MQVEERTIDSRYYDVVADILMLAWQRRGDYYQVLRVAQGVPLIDPRAMVKWNDRCCQVSLWGENSVDGIVIAIDLLPQDDYAEKTLMRCTLRNDDYEREFWRILDDFLLMGNQSACIWRRVDDYSCATGCTGDRYDPLHLPAGEYCPHCGLRRVAEDPTPDNL